MKKKPTMFLINRLNANITKWSNTLEQFIGKLPTNCLNAFDHFVGLALKELKEKNVFEVSNKQRQTSVGFLWFSHQQSLWNYPPGCKT